MTSKARWQNLWNVLTTPQAVDADEARREYMTKVISLIVTLVALGAMIPFVLGWMSGFLPLDSVFVTLGMTLAFGGAWWLAYRGHWRAAGYIPPVVVFLTAVYGNWIGGAGAPAMVLYALSIVLTAVLQSEHAQWIILLLSIAAYLGIGQALLSGYIVQSRFPETAFANRAVIVVGVYIGLASMLWFLINQFRRALVQAHVYAERLEAANQQLEREIIRRQQADESLRESNEVLQALIDCSPLAIVQLDPDGQVLLWNHAAEELYGWTRAEVLGKFAPMISEKYLPEYQAIRTRLLQGETLTNLEVERQREDGSLIQVNLSMAPLRDTHGTITAFVSIIVDITESHKAKTALRESEERFRLFMQHFPGLAYIKDAATHVLFANQGFMDYLNIAPAAILGKTNRDIFPAEFAEQMTADDQHVLESGVSEVIEERYAGRVWATYKFVIPQTDNPTLLGGFTLDITEHKQAEQEVQILARFPAENPNPILRLNQDGTILYANDASQRLLQDWAAGVGGQAPKFWQDHVADALGSRSKRTVEVMCGELSYSFVVMPIPQMGYVNLYAVDITERKQAEEALRESEERFRKIFEESKIGIVLVDSNQMYLAVNKAFCSMVGYSQEELMSRSYGAISHPDDIEGNTRNARALWQGKIPYYKTEKRYIHKDGKIVWAFLETTLIRDSQGNPSYYLSVIEDITERKRAEALLERALRETRVRFEISQALAGKETEDEVLDVLIQHAGLYLQAHVTILTFDRTGSELAVVLRRLDAFESGVPNQMPLGMRLPASTAKMFKFLSSDQPFVSNDLLTDERLDETSRALFYPSETVSHGIFPLTSGNEWLGFIAVTSRLIGYFDEEKQHLYQTLAEQGAVALRAARLRETIRESQQRLSLLVQQSPLAVIEWNTGFHVVSWNPAAERIFGYTGEEALGRHASFIVPEQVQPQVDQVWQSLLAQKGGVYSSNDNLTKDGRRITCEWFNAPLISVSNQIISVASIVQDITERQRAEAERERLIAELESKNAELERFTYSVSHDLKAPLITIRGFLGLLEKDALTGNFRQARSDMERISNATDRMQRLLNELLELSRIGRMMNPSEAVSFEVIAQEAVELVRGRIEARGVQVEIESDLPTVYGDRARLVEVVLNLVDNACKFMGDQPEPRITIGQCGADRDGQPILFVRDNGIGIEMQHHEKVFGLFDKLDAQGEGTGVGLALVKRIVEVHGGRIWLESAGLGKGSTFCFTLPLASTAA